MIYLATALYEEAAPFIRALNLKKNPQIPAFQVFTGEEAVLIITGCGPVPAAIAVTHLCTLIPPGPGDFLINLGSCAIAAGGGGIGTVCLIHKIYELSSHRTFYPDMLFRHPFQEAGIYTSAVPICEDTALPCSDISLADMEAAGIYQAAIIFFRTHQIFFIKVASDYFGGAKPSRSGLNNIMALHHQEIIQWVQHVAQLLEQPPAGFSFTEEQLIGQLIDRLNLSVTLSHQARQLLWHQHLKSGDTAPLLREFMEVRLPEAESKKSKKEGKVLFEEFKNKLI